MTNAPVQRPDSLWNAVVQPGPELPRLAGPEHAEVVVIGGG